MNIRGNNTSTLEQLRESKSSLRRKRRDLILSENRPGKEFPVPENYYIRLSELKDIIKKNLHREQTILAIQELRFYLKERNSYQPITEMADTNIFSCLLQLMVSSNDAEVIKQIAWFYVNAGASDNGVCAILIRIGVVETLCARGNDVSLPVDVAYHCAWALSNIVYDFKDSTKRAFDHGLLNILLRVLKELPDDDYSYWFLLCFLRQSSFITVDNIKPFIPYITNGLIQGRSPGVITHSLLCCYHILTLKDGIPNLLDTSIIMRAFLLCGDVTQSIQDASFKVLKALTCSKDFPDILQYFKASNVFPRFGCILEDSNSALRTKQDILSIITNLAVTNNSFIDSLVANNMYAIAVELIVNNSNNTLTARCFEFIFDSIFTHYGVVVDNLIQQPMFISIYKHVPWYDSQLAYMALKSAEELLYWYDNSSMYSIKDQFYEIGFDKKLDELMNSSYEEVADEAMSLISRFFDQSEI